MHTWIRLVLLILFLCWKQEGTFRAQELTLSGVGPINHSLAGATVALPRDSAGAIFWNPATISFLDHKRWEFQLGMGRHNPPWYGDEYVVGTIGAGVLVVAWLVLVSTSDDNKDDVWTWERRQEQNTTTITINPIVLNVGTSEPGYSRPPHTHSPPAESHQALRETPIRVPTLSYVYHPQESHWSFGLAITEYGAKRIGAWTMGDVMGITENRHQAYEFIPTVSYRESRRFSLGVSPIFSIEEMANGSLPVIFCRHFDSLTQDQRSKAGFGMQAGMFYSPTKHIRFGASVRTPLLISGYTYRWIDPITGELGTQRLHFSQDSAFRLALGTSYTFNSDKTTLALDFRYSDYSHASALYDIPASFDPDVKRQGISRAVYSLALGVEHRPRDIIAFRMGYQWNHAVTPEKSIIYNTGLPIQSGHSIHYGVTFFFSEVFDLSFSSSNAFGGRRETIQTEGDSMDFCLSPNRSNFWASVRFRF